MTNCVNGWRVSNSRFRLGRLLEIRQNTFNAWFGTVVIDFSHLPRGNSVDLTYLVFFTAVGQELMEPGLKVHNPPHFEGEYNGIGSQVCAN